MLEALKELFLSDISIVGETDTSKFDLYFVNNSHYYPEGISVEYKDDNFYINFTERGKVSSTYSFKTIQDTEYFLLKTFVKKQAHREIKGCDEAEILQLINSGNQEELNKIAEQYKHEVEQYSEKVLQKIKPEFAERFKEESETL